MKFGWYLDVNAIAIALSLLLFHRSIVNIKDNKARLYIYACVGMLLLAISDVYWVAVDEGIISSNVFFHEYFSNYLWYFSLCLAGHNYFVFTQDLFELKYIREKSKGWISSIPMVIGIILSLTTSWTGLIFTFSDEGVYERGPLNYVIMIIMFGYILVPAFQSLFLQAKEVSYEKKAILKVTVYFALPPITCGLVQFFNPDIPVAAISGAFSLMILQSQLQYRDVETDNLTQIRNRNGLTKYIEKQIYSIKHSGGISSLKQVAIILVDISKLRKINAEFGQREGEEVLKNVAAILKNIVKEEGGLAARYRGSCFALVINASYFGDIESVEKKVIKELEDFYNQPNQRYKVNVNFGHAPYTAEMHSDVTLLYEAAFENLKSYKEGIAVSSKGGMIL